MNADRIANLIEAIRLARHNAQTARRMASEWPSEAQQYRAAASDAFARACHYVRRVRSLQAIVETRHARAA